MHENMTEYDNVLSYGRIDDYNIYWVTKVCEKEMVVPWGSILSVTSFCLKVNSILLHVDDFLICCDIDITEGTYIDAW